MAMKLGDAPIADEVLALVRRTCKHVAPAQGLCWLDVGARIGFFCLFAFLPLGLGASFVYAYDTYEPYPPSQSIPVELSSWGLAM